VEQAGLVTLAALGHASVPEHSGTPVKTLMLQKQFLHARSCAKEHEVCTGAATDEVTVASMVLVMSVVVDVVSKLVMVRVVEGVGSVVVVWLTPKQEHAEL